jgi:hypothetical protein
MRSAEVFELSSWRTESPMRSPMNLKIWLTVTLTLLISRTVQSGEGHSSFAAVGSFSNMRFTEEHQHGSEVQLWREGARLSGFFFHAQGLMGDAPAGLLEDVRWDPKTGTVSFTSKLTTGQHFCKVHKDVPSRDLFSFRGELSDSSMSGVLKRSDALHPEMPPIEEKVALERPSGAGASRSFYGSRSDWEAAAKNILMFRGPRW